MKKIIILNILIIFIISVSGIVINSHYSNGKLFSKSLFVDAKSCCEESNCCSHCEQKTEIKKIEDGFLSASSLNLDSDKADLVAFHNFRSYFANKNYSEIQYNNFFRVYMICCG